MLYEVITPLGMDLFAENLDKERWDMHVGAFCDKKLIGVLILTTIDEGTLKMRQVAVDENFRSVITSYSIHYTKLYDNDQVRFEVAYYQFNPAIKVIAPWREWDLKSRSALEEYARKHDIPIPTSKKFPWSSDRNLLHISFEGDILEQPWA